MSQQQPITLIGGGLVGALLGVLLARCGRTVEIFEKRPDPRPTGAEEGRSINLALAERGLHALRLAGLGDAALRLAVMMRGRMVHPREGAPNLQRYGTDDGEVIWSMSRAALNGLLLDAAEAAGVRIHFGQTLTGADFDGRRIRMTDAQGTGRQLDSGVLIGADGAGSALRAAMDARTPLGIRVEPLNHGYKELEIPPVAGGGHGRFALEPHALHIWPRGGYMCIALPNAEGSFTVTLFLPAQGAYPSFAGLPDAASARAFFLDAFPDLLPLMPRFAQDYARHPVGALATLYLERWHLGGRAVLVGDAAHAIVPFHGQGMNCGFEDAVLLAALLDEAGDDTAGAFAEFQRRRKSDADAIAAMALENYVEMRDSVADPRYLARRELGARLAERAPEHFMARYRMVSFTRLPYAYALERGRAQDALLQRLLGDGLDAGAVDLAAAEATLKATLPPIRHG